MALGTDQMTTTTEAVFIPEIIDHVSTHSNV